MSDRRQINISVSGKVHERIAALAATSKMSVTAYATLLLEAAYAARCKETGDIDLDTAVGRVALLFGTGFDVASIREATGLSELFIERTLAVWQAEVRGGVTSFDRNPIAHSPEPRRSTRPLPETAQGAHAL